MGNPEGLNKPDFITSVLREGSKDIQSVKNLQELLIKEGFLKETYVKRNGEIVSSADGDFGRGTKNAVKNFQRSYGLEVDGVVGKNTIKKLQEVSTQKNEELDRQNSLSKIKNIVEKSRDSENTDEIDMINNKQNKEIREKETEISKGKKDTKKDTYKKLKQLLNETNNTGEETNIQVSFEEEKRKKNYFGGIVEVVTDKNKFNIEGGVSYNNEDGGTYSGEVIASGKVAEKKAGSVTMSTSLGLGVYGTYNEKQEELNLKGFVNARGEVDYSFDDNYYTKGGLELRQGFSGDAKYLAEAGVGYRDSDIDLNLVGTVGIDDGFNNDGNYAEVAASASYQVGKNSNAGVRLSYDDNGESQAGLFFEKNF